MPISTIAAEVSDTTNDLQFQIGYLGILFALLCGAAFLVVRQVLIRTEMDETLKKLGESIRSGNATSEVTKFLFVLIKKMNELSF